LGTFRVHKNYGFLKDFGLTTANARLRLYEMFFTLF
jgi:hypothetical protein